MADAIEEALDEREAAFVRAHIALGGSNAAQAAIEAGYSANGAAVQGHRLLQRPKILAAIRKEAERSLMAGVPVGAAVLIELARNAKSEAVRLKAGTELLDRGGLAVVARSEHTVTVNDRRSDAELRQHVQQLVRELGLDAKVIDGAPAPVRRPVIDVEPSEGGSIAVDPENAPVAAPQPEMGGAPDAAEDDLPDLFS